MKRLIYTVKHDREIDSCYECAYEASKPIDFDSGEFYCRKTKTVLGAFNYHDLLDGEVEIPIPDDCPLEDV